MWKIVQTANFFNKTQEEELVQLEYVVSHVDFYVETLATNKYYHLGYTPLDESMKEGLYWANSSRKTLTNAASTIPWSRVLNWIKERKLYQHSSLRFLSVETAQAAVLPSLSNASYW